LWNESGPVRLQIDGEDGGILPVTAETDRTALRLLAPSGDTIRQR
jgi:diacylglycerol kinase family enzyme